MRKIRVNAGRNIITQSKLMDGLIRVQWRCGLSDCRYSTEHRMFFQCKTQIWVIDWTVSPLSLKISVMIKLLRSQENMFSMWTISTPWKQFKQAKKEKWQPTFQRITKRGWESWITLYPVLIWKIWNLLNYKQMENRRWVITVWRHVEQINKGVHFCLYEDREKHTHTHTQSG